uniref:Carboxypeptidase regulatory-like domain-containing protein n=1 Tax=Ralstonia solanacearum CFBP2957 TaxID=859656 RepID=D8P644_RALSL|nr:protein of unknown function [Ralstonia solanacearum CFBP2957]
MLAALTCTAYPQGEDSPMNDAPLRGGTATKQNATLVVIVLGNHHPIVNADVQVSATVLSSEPQDLHRMTDANGRASFASIATGAFTVRVIATGWKTTKPHTTLNAGDNQLIIELEAEASQPR